MVMELSPPEKSTLGARIKNSSPAPESWPVHGPARFEESSVLLPIHPDKRENNISIQSNWDLNLVPFIFSIIFLPHPISDQEDCL
jgi:hypothetical protein